MGGGRKKSRPLYQTQPEVYGKVKWLATSERFNFFFFQRYFINFLWILFINKKLNLIILLKLKNDLNNKITFMSIPKMEIIDIE